MKNRWIDKLLKVAKKHKILTYPVLALVALLSIISYCFDWSTGAGKRVVAVVMVMVMLVSQSYFLTSSATALVDDENAAQVQKALQEEQLVQTPSDSGKSDQTSEAVTEVPSDNADKPSTETGSTVFDGEDNDKDNDPDITYTDGDAEEDDDDGIIDIITKEDNEDVQEEDMDSALADAKYTITFRYVYVDATGTTSMGLNSGVAQQVTSNENIGDVSGGDYTYDFTSMRLDERLIEAQRDYSENGCYRLDGWFVDRACTQRIVDYTRIKANDKDGYGNPYITLYCSRNLTKYRVTVLKGNDKNNPSDQVDYEVQGASEPVPNGTESFYIPVEGTGDTASGSMTLANIKREKYALSSVLGATNVTFNRGDNHASFEFRGQTPQWTITLGWSGNPYNIRYAKNEAGAEFVTQQVAYFGGGQTEVNYQFLSGDAVGVEKKEGYEFSTWKIGPDDTATVITNPTDWIAPTYQDELYSESDDQIVTLYPVYTYAGFKIKLDDKVQESISLNLEYDYKKPADEHFLTAEYTYTDGRKDENALFTYSLSGQSELEDHGIVADFVDGNPTKGVVLYTKEGGPTKRTAAPVQLTVTVQPGNGDAPKTFTINVSVKPRAVKVVLSDEQRTKVYDGTTDAPENFPSYLPTDAGDPDVYITITGKAEYNSKNVKDADHIKIGRGQWTLHVPAGEEDNYRIDTDEIIIEDCHITQRSIFMRTTTSKPVIRAGEATPVKYFNVELDPSVSDNRLVGDDRIESVINSITYTTDPERNEDNMEQTGDFRIVGSSPETSNYMIRYANDIPGSAQGTFLVMMETPKLGLNYYFNGTKLPDNSWFQTPNLTILPVLEVNSLGGYDTVCISRDGGKTWEEGGALREEDSNISDLRIKLRDKRTGAVTDDEALSVRYDMTGPEYRGYTVSSSELEYDSSQALPEGGLFFPGIGGVMDFGTYIRSMITIQIRYEDNASGLSTLHYGLFGASAGTDEVPFNKKTGTATIQILRDSISNADTTVGVITCYAVDEAGNPSTPIRLKPDNSSQDDYEWSIEQAGPVTAPLVIKAGDEQTDVVKDQSGAEEDKMVYYHNCKAELGVTDKISGIHHVTWHINDTDIEKRVDNLYGKVTEQIFYQEIGPSSSQAYKVYATVTDNAGNTVDTNAITLKVDDIKPNLYVNYNDATWTKDTRITFTTSDDLSGIDYVKVTDGDGNTIDCNLGKPDANGVYTGTFDAQVKGKYIITVVDKAGNKAVWEKDITNISTVVPDCPDITVSPAEPDGKNGWYRTEPAITVSNVTETVEQFPTPVITSYRRWKTGETAGDDIRINGSSEVIRITDEGEQNVKAWSVSASGIECANFDAHVLTVKHDKSAPVITISPDRGSSASILVNFTVTDEVSGVDGGSIKVLHGNREMAVKIEKVGDGHTYKGSFEVKETGNYAIEAADNAGNNAEQAVFTPMSMKIKPITNISVSSATVGAVVYKGTFAVQSAEIEYRKYTDKGYTAVQSISSTDQNGNVTVSTVLDGLEEGTAYVYKITAVSEQNEVLEYEGYFRTISPNVTGVPLSGTVRYADNHKGTATVGLFDGNVCMMALETNTGEEFTFRNVPDGMYNLVATDGVYSRTIGVMIEEGMVVFPTSYIELVLSGKNTAVEITTSETPKITADNMDSIFDYDSYNFTDKDKALIDTGGTVEFRLCATLMKVSSISANEITAMYAVTNPNKIVGAYLDLSLYKIVTDMNGAVERTRVTELGNGAAISVTIPLGDLAGKSGLEIVRIHQDGDGFIGASLIDMDNNPSTYTITSSQFSTYAVLYNRDVPSSNSTTEMNGGSTDPGTTGDIHITTEDTTERPTTEQPTTERRTTERLTTENQTTEPSKVSGTSVGSLRSAGSAKTGDETPIVAIGVIMLMAMGGAVVLRRKTK